MNIYSTEFGKLPLDLVSQDLLTAPLIKIPKILDTALKAGKAVSPYHELARLLSENYRDKTITIKEIEKNFFSANGYKPDFSLMSLIYALGWRHLFPYVCRFSSMPISYHKYEFNFLWVNLDPQDKRASHIFGRGVEPSTCLDNIKGWARLHPRTKFKLWFDSALVTKKAIKNTWKKCFEIMELNRCDFKLKDIRCLDIPDGLKSTFHPGTPVYYRVDLSKVLVAQRALKKQKRPYCIVLDADITPMKPKYLFDQRTIDFLERVGYVFHRVPHWQGLRMGGFHNIENSFFIFNTENVKLAEIHETTMIAGLISETQETAEGHLTVNLCSQCVFGRYQEFLKGMGWDVFASLPSKRMITPISSFMNNDPLDTPQQEKCRMIDGIPYTLNGRNFPKDSYEIIEALREWTPRLLDISDAITSPEIMEVQVCFDAGWGNWLEIRGTGPKMSWEEGIRMLWSEGNVWKIELSFEDTFEYKIVMCSPGKIYWERGENRKGKGDAVVISLDLGEAIVLA